VGSDTSNSDPRPDDPERSSGEPPQTRRLGDVIRAALPADRFGDHLAILSGTGQNIVGLAVYVLATFGTNVLISRAFEPNGASVLGVVTLATQFAFVAGAATRFGMDMAAVRRVAVDVGKGEPGRARAVVARASAIAALASAVGATAVLAGAEALSEAFGTGSAAVFRAAALALPFVALCQVYLGGTRGLKIMRHTLFIYWAGQPVAWIVIMLLTWPVAMSASSTVVAYAVSWALATVAAWFVWERETRSFPRLPAEPGETAALLRYGAPRAPAALLSQILFWTDYFVASRYVTSAELGVYAAALRVAQALMLFLVAVNYMFSPFVADLHARGQRERLDELYKALTRWMLAGTLPLLLLLLIAPGPVLSLFGSTFDTGSTALRILLIGQLVNVGVGSVGFILIMVGRTGWDLMVYAASFLLDLAVAVLLVPHFGVEGAAVAQTLTMVCSNTGRLYLVWRFVHIQPFDRHYARLAIPAAACGAVMLAVHLILRDGGWPADLVVTGLAGLLAYVPVLLVAGLTTGEKRALTTVFRRTLG
jgi:O-antigen/teichoic acid export membrane protein